MSHVRAHPAPSVTTTSKQVGIRGSAPHDFAGVPICLFRKVRTILQPIRAVSGRSATGTMRTTRGPRRRRRATFTRPHGVRRLLAAYDLSTTDEPSSWPCAATSARSTHLTSASPWCSTTSARISEDHPVAHLQWWTPASAPLPGRQRASSRMTCATHDPAHCRAGTQALRSTALGFWALRVEAWGGVRLLTSS
jgi:hypothetical protein